MNDELFLMSSASVCFSETYSYTVCEDLFGLTLSDFALSDILFLFDDCSHVDDYFCGKQRKGL